MLQVHPLAKDCRLQAQLLQSNPNAVLKGFKVFDKLSSSLGGLMVVDLSQAAMRRRQMQIGESQSRATSRNA